MAILAFVLIRTKTGRELDIMVELEQMEEVREAYMIYGGWDVIARVEVESLPQLDTLVVNIRASRDVQQTATLITA
ncbi:MAG: Lrp/AsnC ligand binding domain-containing protein [Candidatus Hodarchaeota archaeon]